MFTTSPSSLVLWPMKVLLLTILLTKAASCTGTQSLRPYYIRAAVEHEFNGSAVNFTRSGNQTSRTDGSHTREASVDKAGVLSIPVYLDEKAGWYGRFRVGKVPAWSKDESKEWMLEIATAESATWLTSIYQPSTQDRNKKTNASHPLANQEDWSRLTWKRSNIELEAKDSSGNRRFVDNMAFNFLSFQNGRDELDGTIGLAVPGKPLSENAAELNPASRYWRLPGILTFAISFVNKTSAVLQFGVDPDHGDTSQYDSRSDFTWFEHQRDRFEPNFGGSSYKWWTLEVLYISIGPPGSEPWQGQLYPTLDIRLKSHQLSRDANYSMPELANNEEINGKMTLDSASPWTRLHPLLVDYYYSQISTAKSFNNTFYIPCDLEEGGIPEIGVTVWQQEGLSGKRWHFGLRKDTLIVQSYRHPHDSKLGGGSIQYINATIFRKFNRNVDQVFGLIGRSFFQSYYIVFKTIDVSSKAPQRMVGIAGGRVI
ncbi:hypothetical protein TWF225_000606 [Orbilia oligospora]|nr:hypothetical protein TWF225_000606 [Orbilia oligospora]KAF3264682.1 hypothetical protein TWF128_001136 [Orbilia oligospora]KAF3268466.1 hypothetical protein TWF217_011052 [Orbilia oligospora]KAF3280341.1 hypothetical protein TWF132_011802 [Orbilia oligospora]